MNVKIGEGGLDEARVGVSSLRQENDGVIPPESSSHLRRWRKDSAMMSLELDGEERKRRHRLTSRRSFLARTEKGSKSRTR